MFGKLRATASMQTTPSCFAANSRQTHPTAVKEMRLHQSVAQTGRDNRQELLPKCSLSCSRGCSATSCSVVKVWRLVKPSSRRGAHSRISFRVNVANSEMAAPKIRRASCPQAGAAENDHSMTVLRCAEGHIRMHACNDQCKRTPRVETGARQVHNPHKDFLNNIAQHVMFNTNARDQSERSRQGLTSTAQHGNCKDGIEHRTATV